MNPEKEDSFEKIQRLTNELINEIKEEKSNFYNHYNKLDENSIDYFVFRGINRGYTMGKLDEWRESNVKQ
jgi:hypothetical protein